MEYLLFRSCRGIIPLLLLAILQINGGRQALAQEISPVGPDTVKSRQLIFSNQSGWELEGWEVRQESPQDPEERRRIAQRTQIARRLEARGQFDAAIPVWEGLITLDPANEYTYFKSILRCLGALGLHDEAVRMLEDRIVQNPDPELLGDLYIELGVAQYQANRPGQSEIAWKQALDRSRGDETIYMACLLYTSDAADE